MKHYPLFWDRPSTMLLAGTTSVAVLDRLAPLFGDTFHSSLERITAGRLAADQAAARGQQRGFEDLAPPRFPGQSDEASATIAWVSGDPSSRDYWGNEFLLWLWHTLETGSDTIELADGSAVTVTISRTLTLDCPRGETGRDNLASEGPTRLPEARRAIQSGKLPRKAGLILVRHDQEYSLTLQAETLAVSGAKLPRLEGDGDRGKIEARVDQVRHLIETLDLLYDAFGRRRLGSDWSGELARMCHWLEAA